MRKPPSGALPLLPALRRRLVLALVATLLTLPLVTPRLAAAAGSPPPCYQWSPRTDFAALSEGIPPGTSQYTLYFFVNFDYFEGHVYFTSSGAPSSVSIGLEPGSLYVPSGSSFTETPITLTISTPPSYSGSFNLTLDMNSPDGYSEGNICSFSRADAVPVQVGTPQTSVTFEPEKGFTDLAADNYSNLTVYVKTTDAQTGEPVPFSQVTISSMDRLAALPYSDNALQLLKPSVEAPNELTVVTNGTGVAKVVVGPWDTPLLNPVGGSWLYELVKMSATWVPSSTGTPATTEYSLRVFQPPVLLVHGTCSSSETWTSPGNVPLGTITRIDFLQALQSQGLRVSTMGYNSGANNQGDITVEWTKVQTSLDNMQADLASMSIKGQRFDVVAHSLGGLLVRYYTQQDPNEKVNKLIFLGATNNGFFHWSEVLVNDPFYVKEFAGFMGSFMQCLSGSAPVIEQENPVDPVGASFLRSVNSWHGTGLNPEVRHYAVLGTTGLAGLGGKTDDGLVSWTSTTLGGRISPSYYVPGNHLDLTGSQDVVNVVVPILLGNPVPQRYSTPPQVSAVDALMTTTVGTVKILAAGVSDYVLAKGYQIAVGVGQLLSLPVGSSATIGLGANQQVGELLVGSQSRDTVLELGGANSDRMSVVLYSGSVGVIVDAPGATSVSIVVPNALTEVADDAAAFSVSVGDNGSYTVTVLQGNVSLRHLDGTEALALGPSSQVNVDSEGGVSAVQTIASSWPEEAALTGYFKSQGFSISCRVFLDLTQCPQAGQYTPTVRAYDNQTQLTYFGQAVACSDLQSQSAGDMLQALSNRVMTGGNSNGQKVPLIIASPANCSDELNAAVNKAGLANSTNVWYLASGALVRPTLKAPSTVSTSTSATSATSVASASTSATAPELPTAASPVVALAAAGLVLIVLVVAAALRHSRRSGAAHPTV